MIDTTDIAKVGIELAGKAVLPWTTDHHQLDSRTSLLGFFEGNNDDASDYLIYACNNFVPLAKRVLELEDERDRLVAVAEAAEDINKMLSCIDPPDLETATNTTLALEESLTRWHCR